MKLNPSLHHSFVSGSKSESKSKSGSKSESKAKSKSKPKPKLKPMLKLKPKPKHKPNLNLFAVCFQVTSHGQLFFSRHTELVCPLSISVIIQSSRR